MEKVRITSGRYRGKILKTPGGATHPMGAREKLALFNMVTDYIDGASVLDAFAGSGALGMEALSRGAASVIFVEKSPLAARVINQNLDNLGIKNPAKVIVLDIAKFQPDERFDLILADPPYDHFNVSEIVGLAKLLNKGGMLVLSHPGESPELSGLELKKARQYARAKISIYSKSIT